MATTLDDSGDTITGAKYMAQLVRLQHMTGTQELQLEGIRHWVCNTAAMASLGVRFSYVTGRVLPVACSNALPTES